MIPYFKDIPSIKNMHDSENITHRDNKRPAWPDFEAGDVFI